MHKRGKAGLTRHVSLPVLGNLNRLSAEILQDLCLGITLFTLDQVTINLKITSQTNLDLHPFS